MQLYSFGTNLPSLELKTRPKIISRFPPIIITLPVCGLYYKHRMIVNYTSSIVKKLEALLTDNARVIIYDLQVFIVQATGLMEEQIFLHFY